MMVRRKEKQLIQAWRVPTTQPNGNEMGEVVGIPVWLLESMAEDSVRVCDWNEGPRFLVTEKSGKQYTSDPGDYLVHDAEGVHVFSRPDFEFSFEMVPEEGKGEP